MAQPILSNNNPNNPGVSTGTINQVPLLGNGFVAPTPANNGSGNSDFGSFLAQLNAYGLQGNNAGNIGAQNSLANQLRMQAQGNGTPAQQAYAAQLHAQAAGQGPSLAQSQLGQATAQNAAQAASQAASARGLNPAMASRMAGENQANLNQQAAGQSALIRGNEQQQAMGALGQQANTVAGQGLQANQIAGGIYQGVGSQNLAQQGSANSLFNTAASSMNAQNAINAGLTNNANTINANTSGQNAALLQGIVSGGTNALGSLGSKFLGNGSGNSSPNGSGVVSTDGNGGLGAGVDPGPDTSGVDMSGGDTQSLPFAHGGIIPGDHPQNDVVPAMLSPGEIVLPRSVTQGPDPVDHAAAFVAALKGQGPKSHYDMGGDVIGYNPNSLASAISLGGPSSASAAPQAAPSDPSIPITGVMKQPPPTNGSSGAKKPSMNSIMVQGADGKWTWQDAPAGYGSDPQNDTLQGIDQGIMTTAAGIVNPFLGVLAANAFKAAG